MMEKFPQQPKNLNKEDTTNLAVLGHRIEMWNAARSGSGSIEERRDTLMKQMQHLLDTMAHSAANVSHVEFAELQEDFERVNQFKGDEHAFADLCAEHEEYYLEVRSQYIQSQAEIGKKDKQA